MLLLQCFASWALAPLQAAEAQLKRQGGPWLSLSAQQVLDCTFRAANANETCNGDDDPRFNPLDAARHIQRVGLALEADYLYVPEWASGCRSDVRTYRIPLRLVEVPDGREDMLAQVREGGIRVQGCGRPGSVPWHACWDCVAPPTPGGCGTPQLVIIRLPCSGQREISAGRKVAYLVCCT